MAGLSVAVLVAGNQGPVFADPTGPADSTGPAADPSSTTAIAEASEVSRPDRVSAVVTARATGQPVEDLSQRDEFSRVFANPDGTWTVETAPAPERVRDAAGAWRDVDTTLVETDRGFAPAYAAADVVFSPGGDRTFAAVSEAGRDLKWRWTGESVLPEPVVEGDTATYPDVVPGGDLVVTALSTGFSHSIVLHEQPAGPVEFTVPVVTDGATLSETPQGGLTVETPAGREIVSAPQPLMWDAAETPAGDPANVAPVDTTVGKTPAGTPTITLAPDAGFLADPDTVYPVTVDPSFTTYASGDAWVQNAGYTTGQTASKELRAGTYDGGGHVARSYIHFDGGDSKWRGKKIESAKLVLRNFYSGSCTGAAIEVRRLSEAWDGNTLTWANRPSGLLADKASFSPAYGYTSTCDADDATWNVTDMVQVWANDTSKNHGLSVLAANETSNYTWRKYRSANYNDHPATEPHLNVTYNSYPGTASQPSLSPAATWTPAGGSSTYYTSTTKPTMTAKATDADGGTVRLYFEARASASASATLLSSCTTSYVASGSNAACTLGTALPDDSTVSVRAKAYDGSDWAGKSQTATSGWSSWRTFKVAAATPAAPAITCTGYADGSWTDAVPTGSVPCRISATGTGTNAPGYLKYSVDGGTVQRVQIPQSADPAVAMVDVTVSNRAGGHRISAWAESPSGKVSSEKKYAFGYGRVGIDSPATDPMPVTTGALAITASGPPASTGAAATAELQWRLASSGDGEETGWNTAKSLNVATDATTGGLAITGSWDTMSVKADAAAGIDLDARVPTTLELQVCVTYTAGVQCTWNSGPLRVLRVPHAFGDGFPVADAGPGQVALWTGEFATTATDVTVPGYVGDLSISRTHGTFAGDASVAAGVFGPGWTASFDGPDTGLAGFELVDNTQRDGTVLLLSPEGDPIVFAPASWRRRTGADLATGEWIAVDDATEDLGVSAKVSGTGTSTTFAITTADDVTTTFRATTAPGAATPAVFAPESVAEPGVATATSYAKDATGRVTRILAPIPTGMTATDCPKTGALSPGCRALDITYATATTATAATPGDIAGQVKRIALVTYDPDKTGGAGMNAIPVAEYTYNSDRRLVAVTDPRVNLTSAYGYDGSGRLVSVTDPGLTPYQLEYSGTPAKLARVKRERPASAGGGTATVATVLYGVPTSGAGLPDLSTTAVSEWGQSTAPSYAAAVFGADKPITTLDPAQVVDGDWSYAAVFATDERGYTTNTATFGAGGWLPTWTEYNTDGYVTRELDAGDIAAVRAGEAVAAQAGTRYVYNTANNGPAQTPAGTMVTDTYGTPRWVVLDDTADLKAGERNGNQILARPHTEYVYDENAPDGGINPDTGHGWGLVTTTKSQPVAPDTLAALEPATVTRTGYGTSTAQWKLGFPTTSTQVMDGAAADIVTRTGYDAEGRVISQQQPKSNGADAGTRTTVYYTVATNSTHPQCGGKPQWAGLVCRTAYAGQATGQDLLTTEYGGFNAYLAAATVTETANDATRTTTMTFDGAGRPLKSQLSATGLTGSQPVNGTETVYSPSTGLPVQQWALNTSGARVGDPIETGYDAWGRPTSYTPAPGELTTTTYDTVGRIAQVTDPRGTTSYGYGNDANGNPERRGLPTSLTVTGGPAGALKFTGAYNADGTLILEKAPGDITKRIDIDLAGEQIGLTYSGQVTTDNADGTTTVQADAGWLGWSLENDYTGRVRREWTPTGAGFTADALTNGAAAPYDRAYSYDQAGRLTKVEDRTSAVGAGFDDTTGDPIGQACETRAYAFDANGNRTSLTRTPGNPDGSCSNPATGTTSRSWTYDAGDRLTGGYTYDPFGRQATLPAADAPTGPAAGAVTLGYFDTDAIASITQNGTTTTFGLDQAGRRRTEATGPTGQNPTTTITRHYTDAGDNPAWVATTGTGAGTTRYAETLGGDLGLTLHASSGGTITAELTVADPHGDIVTTIDLPTSGTATGITAWTDTDEYGNPLAGIASTGAVTDGLAYGWLGAHQRAATDTGLILMGARLYNPTTGTFTSTDPIYGGNTTAYTYPQDPLNRSDLDGRNENAHCRGCGGTGGAGTGFGRVAVSFGHGARHMRAPGYSRLSVRRVEKLITRQVTRIVRTSHSTGEFWGRIKLGNRVIEYRAFTRHRGHVNVGTYYPGP